MAKVGFWLRGARGKLAGSVLMKGEKGTVARESVSPANPKTWNQALQRAVFATVSKFAAALSTVVSNSFDGCANGKLSRREFIKRNLQLLKDGYLAGENAYLGVKGAYTPMPNALVISSGSLGRVIPTYSNESGVQTLTAIASSSTTSITLSDLKALNIGIAAGSQLTFVGVFGEITDKTTWKYGFSRIVLGDWVQDNDVIFNITDGTINGSVIVSSKTLGFKGIASDGSIDISREAGNLISVFLGKGIVLGDQADMSAMSGGMIVSLYDADKADWLHTESFMVALTGLDVDNDGESIPSYMKAAAVEPASDWYTEQSTGNVATSDSYQTIGQAMQAVVYSNGYATKSISFDTSNTYGPIPEGNYVTMELYPNSGCTIKVGSVRVLNGENAIEGLTIQRNTVGQVRIKFPLPTGSGNSRPINVTFRADYGYGEQTYGFRDTISVVQN